MGTAPRAEEVKIEHLGLELVGNLELAGQQAETGRAVVLIVHDALSFHGAEAPRALQAGLAVRGVASLAITLSLGLDQRRKPFDCTFEQDHRDADAVQEISAWTEWLAGRGAKSVVLTGEGAGALQVATPPETSHAAVRGLVLIAPGPSDDTAVAADYRARFGSGLADVLANAHRVGAEAGEDTIMDVPGFLTCPRARVTAGAFLDAYDRAGRPSLASLLRQRGLPVLLFLGPDDSRAPSFRQAGPSSTGGPMFEIEELSTGGKGRDPAAGRRAAGHIADFVERQSR
jgi:hypothetical protein